MRREGRHILETIERYAPAGYDPLTEDMTVQFAMQLVAKDAENARLRAALEPFARFTQGGRRPTQDDWQRASAVHTNTATSEQQSNT